ncbi:hypothetical protein MU582_06920 [Nocardioidaceae bacterium SCSIO 66511]|nr:hypothetical protein MU582_06920 [Nocardioidaceae bacterium SCSIO 66511]
MALGLRPRRISRDEFVEVWREAEALWDAQAGGPPPIDWYTLRVVRTCRWLARAGLEAPVTRKTAFPLPEEVEAQLREANVRFARARRLGDSDYAACMAGVSATLEWSWRRIGPSPLSEPQRRRALASAG